MIVLAVVLTAVAWHGPVGDARGADCTTISGATVVSTPGCYVIDGNVEEHEDGNYVEIEASDVVLDGDGHTLEGGGNNNAVHVDGSYSNVTVRNLTVENWDRGVFVKDVTDATVRDVVGRSSKHTIEFDGTMSSTVDNVSASSNAEYGVYLKDATGTTVVDTTVQGNGVDGVFVDGGDATLTAVTADTNTEHGVHLKGADGSTVREATATGNTLHGVYVEDALDGRVVDSVADDNGDAGVRVHHSDRTVVTNVTADRNTHGVHLSSPTTTLNDSRLTANVEGVRLKKHVHTVANVTVESSSQYGIYLDEPDDNVVHGSRINASGTAGIYFPDDRPENNLLYDNYLNNSENVRFAGNVPPTDWNVSRRTGTNVVGGALVGGNYWAAPGGDGPSQLYDNADGDAFLDTSYTVGSGTTDSHPLTDVTAAFDVTPAPYDFGSVAFGSTASQSFTVESRVGGDVTVDAFALAGDTGSFAVSTDPSPVTLSTGGTTTVDVTLSPATTGTLSATLTTDAATDAYDTETALSATITDDTVPTATTQADVTVDDDTAVGFDGTGSTDDVGIASYDWAFGDGTTTTGTTPSHTYAAPGTYTATLTVTDLVGNTDTDTRTVTVTDVTDPVAEAGANRTVHVNDQVSFDGTGSTDDVGVVSYDWDFGDGTTTSGGTVTNTYTTTGTYTVTLTATDAAGNEGTDTATIEVNGTFSPIARPGPDRTVDEDTTIGFDGSDSTDDGTITSYEWDFGTGDVATGVTPTYTFDDPGSYVVNLTVTDDVGNVGSNETVVTVRDVTDPTVDAGADTSVDEDTSVSFATATATDNVGVVSYDWEFGDGNTSTAATPSHTYTTPGSYTATLTLTDDAGNTADDTRTVTVADVTDPVAAAGTDRTVSVGESVAFDGSGSTDNTDVDSHDWAFGDGTTTTGSTPSHTYDTPGTYTATLTVADAAGNEDTASVTVYVSDTTDPVPDAGGDRTVTEGRSVEFDASGSTDDVGVTAYVWQFEDGETVTGPSTTRTFESTGARSVTLTVRDAAGNRASESIQVTVTADTTSTSGGAGGVPPPTAADPTPTPAPTTSTPTGTASSPDPTVRTGEADVTAGTPATIELAGGDAEADRDVGVTEIGFTPSVSERVTLRVTTGRDLDGSPAFDREDNTAKLSHVRVDHSIDDADVTDVSVGFSVSKARLADLGVPAEDVALYRYEDGTWTELPTAVVGERDDGYAFSASSPGLSEFAVGAKQPKFALQTVRVDVNEIRVGDDLRVFVRITNDGGADGSFVANLLIDDAVVERRELTIAAGGRRQVRFERPIEAVGSYTVRVNDAVAGEVIVTKAGDTDTTTTTDATTDTAATVGTDDVAPVGAVLLGVLALTGTLVGYYRRHSGRSIGATDEATDADDVDDPTDDAPDTDGGVEDSTDR
ncbi:PKD domain-containing protein [Salinigranum salinum]|uniref:PKD domain-containing protein n=1 Tax=Salinigranum salinum TaxID=1364937 RepID=UPI0018640274|nr:PKD domain-containing protein [Salinigranum salinum]